MTFRYVYECKYSKENDMADPAQNIASTPRVEIDSRVYDLYDEYCHGHIDRREFLARARALVIGGISALAMAQALFPRYAEAQTISFTDARIKARYVDYPSPGGNSGTMRGYLVQPAGTGPFPAVLVFHENRGLNPYVEDVARRAGTRASWRWRRMVWLRRAAIPAMTMTAARCSRAWIRQSCAQDMVNSARFLKTHALSTGKLGATGFCWGGGMVNQLAVALGADLLRACRTTARRRRWKTCRRSRPRC